MNRLARLIAFYLPQYHPIPENDKWWGKGFTEWTNVAKARPLFKGHYQPHLPADLGFYDLRLPEVRSTQADLARQYGIHGFCYYHYWFGGQRLLERPFNEVLESGEPDFPFCLCWANENWSRTWDGGDDEILMAQDYSVEEDLKHIRWLCRAFEDPRYIRIDGKPLFLVYKALRLPHPKQTSEIWREEANRLGTGEILLCSVECSQLERKDPRTFGFDAAVEFAPDWRNTGPILGRNYRSKLLHLLRHDSTFYEHRVFDYNYMIESMMQKAEPPYPRFPCVMPMWDNSARRKINSTIFHRSTPELYERWLSATLQRLQSRDDLPHLCFIDAWNEWGEGNHLEPCQRWGRSYLEATRRALDTISIKTVENCTDSTALSSPMI